MGIDLGVEWDPNVPEAVMLAGDEGETVLALNPHVDDDDQRAVVLCWRSSSYQLMSSPNDEAISGHRLYDRGLKDVRWAGEVHGSELISALERQNSVHSRHDPAQFVGLVHHVVLTKESTVEVVAGSVTVKRLPGSTVVAACQAFLE